MTPFDIVLIFDGVVLVAATCVIFILQRQRIAQLQEKLKKSEQPVTSPANPASTYGYDLQIVMLEMKTLIYLLEKRLSTQNLFTWVLVVFCFIMSMIVLIKP